MVSLQLSRALHLLCEGCSHFSSPEEVLHTHTHTHTHFLSLALSLGINIVLMISLTPRPSYQTHVHVLTQIPSLFSAPLQHFLSILPFLHLQPFSDFSLHLLFSLTISLYIFSSLSSRCSNVIRCTERVVSAPVTALKSSPLARHPLLPISYYRGQGHKGQVLSRNETHSGTQSFLVMELWPGFLISTSDLCSFSSSSSPQPW